MNNHTHKQWFLIHKKWVHNENTTMDIVKIRLFAIHKHASLYYCTGGPSAVLTLSSALLHLKAHVFYIIIICQGVKYLWKNWLKCYIFCYFLGILQLLCPQKAKSARQVALDFTSTRNVLGTSCTLKWPIGNFRWLHNDQRNRCERFLSSV